LEIAMGEVVTLHSTPFDLATDVGHAFVVDATRAAEGLITDKELSEKYELTPADWHDITKNAALGRAVRAERERRVRDGTAVREAAQKHIVKGPGILDGIMNGADSHPKHRIEAYKELRQTAAIGSGIDGLAESTRFIIRIDLSSEGKGEHIEDFDVPREPIKIDISDENLIALEGKSDGDE
jgi:hypothetical protein